MAKGFPTSTTAGRSGQAGLDLVSQIVHEQFQWLLRRVHQEHDFGIDALVDVVLADGVVTGQMVAMQIKHGNSFFRERSPHGYIYRGETKHLNYLANYPVPVLIVLCDPATKVCYWVHFSLEETERAGAHWKIVVPFQNKLREGKKKIEALLPPPKDHLPDLEAYWAVNNLINDVGYIHFVVDRTQVISHDTAWPRTFFDRLRISRAVAMSAQGKVEISFHGYEQDPRELFEIKEMRTYIKLLDAALGELFFFARTGPGHFTLRTFAMCQTKVTFVKRSSTRGEQHAIVFDTAPVGRFLNRHWGPLNEMTEWLGLPIEENKRISYAVMKVFGIEVPEDDA